MSGENVVKLDYDAFMTELWTDYREDLEKTSVQMKEMGIDFFAYGIPMRITENGNQILNVAEYPDEMQKIVDLSKSSYIDQFGLHGEPTPLFTGGEGYFYISTPLHENAYGEEICLTLVYSNNPVEELSPYTNYRDLGSGWLLVTEHFGE